ncbi:MAG: YqeG family HAD IIIA-type phosphatase [Desulfotomaculales bacterium]
MTSFNREMNLLDLLTPSLCVPSVPEIDLARLRSRGICGLLLDLDNTIIRRDHTLFAGEVVYWVERAKREGFKLGIVSNNRLERVRLLARELGLPAVGRAVKPFPAPFRQAMAMLGTVPGQSAIVGDQLFTDILGGNLLGLYTILVPPLPGGDFWGTRIFNRQLEKFVLRLVKGRRPKMGNAPFRRAKEQGLLPKSSGGTEE